MYSMVLVAAMSTAPMTPDFGGRSRGGCSGCYGCSGCGGGGGGFLGLGLFSSSSRYGSCSGSCYGSCYGSCRGCSGCYGSSVSMSCYGGGVSCYGGCFGSSYLSMYAAVPYAAPMMPFAPPLASEGIPSIAPPLAAGIPSIEPPVAEGPDIAGLPPVNAPTIPGVPSATVDTTSNFATVVVTLPADAKLFVEGQEWTNDANQATRIFRTPPIDAGRDYFYAFKIEVVRGGRTLSQSQEARLQAGKTSRVTFAELSAGTSRSVTQFAVRTSE